MGLLWSKPLGTDYEKILTDLTARIVEVEGRVKNTRRQQRSVSLWCLSYGSLLYVIYGLWVFLYPRGPPSVPYRPLLDAFGLVGGPLLIYQVHRLLSWLYARRITYYDAQLREYRGQQRLKVEELKRTTAYYKTKGLIERFEVIDDDDLVHTGEATNRAGSRMGIFPSTSTAKSIIPKSSSLPPPATTASSSLVAPVNAASVSAPSHPLALPPTPPAVPTTPTWLDRLVDAIIGDDRNSRYALICQKCLSHNGLARPEDFETVQYICPSCHHLNGPRRAIFSDVALPNALGASSNSSLVSAMSSPVSAPAAALSPSYSEGVAPDVTPKQKNRIGSGNGGKKGGASSVRHRRTRRTATRNATNMDTAENDVAGDEYNEHGNDSNIESD